MSFWQCPEVSCPLFQTRIQKKEEQPGGTCGMLECGKPLFRICTGIAGSQATNENRVTKVDLKHDEDSATESPSDSATDD